MNYCISTLKAGVVYFVLVFAAGWVLGPIRVLWVVPHLGRTVGVLLEAPLMLLAIIFAARWVVRRCAVPDAFKSRISMGLIALGCLMIAEVGAATWLRGIPVREYLADFGTIPGLITLLLFLIFAVMPVLVGQ